MNQQSNGIFDIEVRAHSHYYYHVQTVAGHVINLPGWKFRDDYAASLGNNAYCADIGWVLVEITDDGQIIINRDVYQSVFSDNFVEHVL